MPDKAKAVIALDAMGGDFGPEVIIPAAQSVLNKRDDLKIILVGREDEIRSCASRHDIEINHRLTVRHASEIVGSHDDPASAMRKKKDSSMRVAINLVHQGEAQAIVSAGNTGALMATARFVLKMLPGINRPAICATIPSMSGHTHMLDLGANTDCSAENLLQFAIMGSVLAEAMENIERPKVGLLNIGHESTKGNVLVKQTHDLLVDAPLNYIGFVEGDDIYNGVVDVVVCDGFVGNVSLKTAEGVAKMITSFMKEEFKKGLYGKIAALFALPVLKAFKRRIDPRAYNGASLLGLKGIVIKSHGSADVFSFSNAIEIALLEIHKSVPLHISEHIEPLLERKAV